MTQPAAYHPRPWLPVVVLTLAVLLAHATALFAGFAYDNHVIVLTNPMLRGLTWPHVEYLATHDYWLPYATSSLYRPLTMLTFLLNAWLLGYHFIAAGFVVFNILLHLVNTFLVYLLLRRILSERTPALFASVLFAVHPITSAAVANLVGRADLLALTAILAGLLLYMRLASWTGPRRIIALIGVAACTLGGMLAKENVAILPALMVLHDTLLRPRGLGARWLRGLGAYFIVLTAAAAALALRYAILITQPPLYVPFLDNPLVGTDHFTARLTAMRIVVSQLLQLCVPWRLAADYSYDATPLVTWPLNTWPDVAALLSAAILVALVVVIVLIRRRRPRLAFCIGAWLLMMLPTSNLLVLIGTIRADRFLYVPLVAFCAGIGALLYGAKGVTPTPHRRRAATAVLLVVAVFFTARTAARNLDWHSDLALWRSAVNTVPHNAKAHQMLALALFQQPTPDLRGALLETEKAQAIIDAGRLPLAWQSPAILRNLGVYAAAIGNALRQPDAQGIPQDTPQSIMWYQRAEVALEHAAQVAQAQIKEARQLAGGRDLGQLKFGPLYLNLGAAHLRADHPAQAAGAFFTMASFEPANPQPYALRGRSLLLAHQPAAAVAPLFQAILLDPDSKPAWQSLDEALTATGHPHAIAVTPAGPTLHVPPDLAPTLRTAAATLDRALSPRRYTTARQSVESRAATWLPETPASTQ